ncbi:isochorismate synthase [Microbacterium sp. X-17]|uniref:isochorismate synthase n=1 Tax=Microbacterium sp. X-17 TaxID=3144404 RepID=UPI0031F4D3B6
MSAGFDDAFASTDPADPLVWLRRGEGMFGAGPAVLRIDDREPGPRGARAARLSAAWREVAAAAEVDDPLGIPGTGLVAFGALAFDERSDAPSTLIVPSVITGRRGDTAWITRIRTADAAFEEAAATEIGPEWSAALAPGAESPEAYAAAVEQALTAIDAGEVAKVVLARDLAGRVPPGADLRRTVARLATGYPDTWVYAVDGLIGASPETLVTVSRGAVTARVLAGTAPRGDDPDSDAAAALALATSPKDQDEHQYAVRSLVRTLEPHTRALAASEQPFALKLPNVWHLATDVEAELRGDASALDLVGALHPTAAVAGTPTDAAIEVIRRLEPFDRGRYAGPVGWIDHRGDGEWAIALRCAQFTPDRDARRVTAHAGAGIVSGSRPESETLETRVKFRAILEALA